MAGEVSGAQTVTGEMAFAPLAGHPGQQSPSPTVMPAVPCAFVSFKGVQKSYDGVSLVVKNLSLDIAKGEFLTLLGPSGSGKTTSLMMLAGFEVPTAGHIRIDGHDVTRLPPHQRGIGMVFQNYALFPHMSVAANVAFPLEARGRPQGEIAESVRRALARVQMEALGDRRPSQLSGGQQQRVALARALVFEPSLVLMDEPLGALDKQLRDHLQMEIKHLHAELGITIVYVTHDQDEALAMSDRVAIFNGGVIEQIGVPQQIYEAPETLFVSSFVGENNHLNGHVLALLPHGAVRLAVAGGEVIASAVGLLAVGEAVCLSLRPERIRPLAAEESSENRIEAQLVDLVYFGDHVRLKCRLSNGETLTVKHANDGRLSDPQPGAMLTLGWRVADARALSVKGGRAS